MNYKPFNKERALAGDPVITREGHPVEQLTYFHTNNDFKLVGVRNGYIEFWKEDGNSSLMGITNNDLFMAPLKREGWINICTDQNDNRYTVSTIFISKEEAIEYMKKFIRITIIDTIKIEWHE